jgi:hypothetical protein
VIALAAGAVVVALLLHGAVVAGAVGAVGAVTALIESGHASGSASGDGGAAADDAVPARFAQTITYDDGLKLSISEPVPFEPSPEARGGGQTAAVTITITLHNGGAEEVPLRASSSVVSKGTPASVVVDAANGLSGVPPVGSIAPGQTVSYSEGYSVADASEVVVLLEPSPDYYPARFAFGE